MEKKEPGRQKKKRHLGPSERSGKATRQVKCPACGEYGHRRGSWKCSKTGTKKRTRTKKSAPKPGRKKAKTDPTPSGGNTPRTRLALAREAAAKAAREAQEAAEKAMAAAEVATAAERQMMPALQIEPPSSPPVRRSLCWEHEAVIEVHETALLEPPTKKMTPRRKVLATKKKKSPAKKGKK